MRKLCCGRAKKEIMTDQCVAANCGNMKDKERNISMHRFPFYGDTRPEAQKRRKRWVDWVKLKRAKWEPSEHSIYARSILNQKSLCSSLAMR